MNRKRSKTMVSFTLDPKLVERMKMWIAKQDLPPPQNAMIAAAIKEFLDRRELRNG